MSASGPAEARPSLVPPSSFGPGSTSRDALISLVYGTAVRLGTVGLSIAAARRLGSAGAGALGVALQVVALSSLLATFSLPQGLTRHLARATDPAEHRRLLLVSAALIGGFALAACLLLVSVASWLARNVYADPELVPVLIACGPLTFAAAAYLWVEGAMQGLRRFGSLARWGAVVASADLVVGVVAASWSVVVMLIARAAVRLVAAGFALSRWLAPVALAVPGPEPVTRRVAAMSLLGFAGPTFAAGGALLLGNTLLRVLLVRGTDLAAAGHYQAADSLAQAVTLVTMAAAAAFLPAMSAHGDRPDRELAGPFRRAIEQVTGYNLALCLAAIGLAPWVMQNVFGRNFEPARPA